MSALPILLLGGAALLIMSKKKKTTSSDEGFIPQIPELPEQPDETGEPDYDPGEDAGPQVGDTVESGIRRDRTGAHNWGIKLAESGYAALDYPTGHRGPKDDIGFSETIMGAKKILSDFYNEALVDAGYPEEVKNDPGHRLTAGAAGRLRAR